jgi:hypothetical protein
VVTNGNSYAKRDGQSHVNKNSDQNGLCRRQSLDSDGHPDATSNLDGGNTGDHRSHSDNKADFGTTSGKTCNNAAFDGLGSRHLVHRHLIAFGSDLTCCSPASRRKNYASEKAGRV